MGTEEAVQQFWLASMAWRGRKESQQTFTTAGLFRTLKPLYEYPSAHRSNRLAAESWELSEMIVKWKSQRCPKPRRLPKNVIQLPLNRTLKTKVA